MDDSIVQPNKPFLFYFLALNTMSTTEPFFVAIAIKALALLIPFSHCLHLNNPIILFTTALNVLTMLAAHHPVILKCPFNATYLPLKQ